MIQIQIFDQRKRPNSAQIENLKKKIEDYRISESLENIKHFLGVYGERNRKVLKIHIIDGTIGEGELSEGIISITLPNQSLFPQVFLLWIVSSTLFHEGIHWLINSKPGSKLHQDLAVVTGLGDKEASCSTLLDEGIAYAGQFLFFTSKIPFFLKFFERFNINQSEKVKKRKILGRKLMLLLKRYLDIGRAIDKEFLVKVNQLIQETE